MARTIWTGALSFGLVNVPVGLYSATEDKSVRFNQFQAGTADRVRSKRVNERTGEEVGYEQIVKGYDLGAGEYVIVTPEEIASVAPGKSRTIDVVAFVDLAEIDPVYFERPYFLAPHGNGGERAYALLLQAMTTMNKVAIATFVMRDREYLAAVRPYRGALVLETLLHADEVRDPLEEIDTLPVEATFDQRELDMAELLIDSMQASWKPEEYVDTYRERLMDLIEQKCQGRAIVVEPQHEVTAPVVDLLEALQASVSAARGTAGSKAAGSKAAGSKAAGSKAAASSRAAASKPGDSRAAGSGKAAGARSAGAPKSAASKSAASKSAASKSAASKSAAKAPGAKTAVRPATGTRRRAS